LDIFLFNVTNEDEKEEKKIAFFFTKNKKQKTITTMGHIWPIKNHKTYLPDVLQQQIKFCF